MYTFLGDSHSRQFVGTATWGIFLHPPRLLPRDDEGPGSRQNWLPGTAKIIRHARHRSDRKNRISDVRGRGFNFLFHREVCRDLVIDLDEFLRAELKRAVNSLMIFSRIGQAAPFIRHFCILGPQISPLRGDGFIRQTFIQAGVAEDRLREHVIFSISVTRPDNRKVVEFNDRLEATFANRDRISFCRIDKEMVDANFAIKDVFAHPNPLEHHAATWETVQVWRPLLSNYMDLLRPQFEHE